MVPYNIITFYFYFYAAHHILYTGIIFCLKKNSIDSFIHSSKQIFYIAELPFTLLYHDDSTCTGNGIHRNVWVNESEDGAWHRCHQSSPLPLWSPLSLSFSQRLETVMSIARCQFWVLQHFHKGIAYRIVSYRIASYSSLMSVYLQFP